MLAVFALSWLILCITQAVHTTGDSEGYEIDARNLFVPSYQTIRPVLFPLFLRVVNTVGLKLSIGAYIIEAAVFLYFIRTSSGKWFSPSNCLVMIGYFLLTGIWSYCCSCLTESILLAVELGIFISLTRMFFPKGKQPIWVTVVYALLICLLGITLKPWIMLMIMLTAVLLTLASLLPGAFKTKKTPSLVLLIVSLFCFVLTYQYNRTKSAEGANMVMLMVSSGNEDRLRDRLQNDKTLTPDKAAFIATLLSDIDVINKRYNGNVWYASTDHAVKLLNIWQKEDLPYIHEGFHLMYLEHARDVWGLAWLSVYRYFIYLRVGTESLDRTFNPELPGLRQFGVPIFLLIALGFIRYTYIKRGPPRPFKDALNIFTVLILLSSVAFGLFLSLAGANELERNVLPAVLFQLFALTYLLNIRSATP